MPLRPAARGQQGKKSSAYRWLRPLWCPCRSPGVMQRERMSHGGASTWVLRWWQSKHEKDFLKMMSECTLAQCVHICHKMGVCVEQSCWEFTFLLLWKVMQCCVFRVTQGRGGPQHCSQRLLRGVSSKFLELNSGFECQIYLGCCSSGCTQLPEVYYKFMWDHLQGFAQESCLK